MLSAGENSLGTMPIELACWSLGTGVERALIGNLYWHNGAWEVPDPGPQLVREVGRVRLETLSSEALNQPSGTCTPSFLPVRAYQLN